MDIIPLTSIQNHLILASLIQHHAQTRRQIPATITEQRLRINKTTRVIPVMTLMKSPSSRRSTITRLDIIQPIPSVPRNIRISRRTIRSNQLKQTRRRRRRILRLRIPRRLFIHNRINSSPLCARIPTVTGSNLFHLLLCGAPNLTGCSVTHATGQRASDSVATFYGLINSFSVEAFDTLSSCFSPTNSRLASNFFDNPGQEITDTGSRVIIFNTLLPTR